MKMCPFTQSSSEGKTTGAKVRFSFKDQVEVMSGEDPCLDEFGFR